MTKRNTIANQLILGGVIYFSYFTRETGLFLIPSLIVYQLSQLKAGKLSETNRVFYFIPYLVFAVFFCLNFLLLPNGTANHYKLLFRDLSISVFTNRIYYYYYYTVCSIWFLRLGILFFIAAIAGIIVTWKQNLHFIVYTLLTLAVLLVFPADQGVRYLFPVFPFFLFFFIKGLLYFFDILHFKIMYRKIFFAITATALFVLNVKQIFLYSKEDHNKCYIPEMQHIYSFISKNTSPDSIIGSKAPRVIRLFTNRNIVCTDEAHFSNSVAAYLLVAKTEYKHTNLSYKEIYQTENYILLSK